MSNPSHMNAIVGQGTAIKEIHNVKKQSLEVSQQFVAQDTEGQKKKDKSKIQIFDQKDKVEIKPDKEKENQKEPKDNKQDADSENEEDEFSFSEGNLIDITI